MSTAAAVAAASVVLAAALVAWPATGRTRLRRVLPAAKSDAGPTPATSGRRRRRWLPLAGTLRGGSMSAGRTAVVLLAAAGVAGGVGEPVAALAAAAYGSVAGALLRNRARGRRQQARRREQLDGLGAAAADLRAGVPAATALPAPGGDRAAGPAATAAGGDQFDEDPIPARVRAAVVLAERTGAPLAELLERIEADARAGGRAHAAAAAQAAGARATAWLLAALPAGGLALGYAIGADPLTVLLHTPLGAGCAGGAIALQLGGLEWSRRLTRVGQVVPS